MKSYWNYAVLKHWKKDIYAKCITHDDYMGKAIPEFYETVMKITFDGAIAYDVQPETLKKVVRMRKDNQQFLLPIEYEEHLPVIVTNSFECQLKPSEKKIYRYVTGIKSMSIPADNHGKSFKEFIQSFNPVDHTEPEQYDFLRILSVASKYKSVKCCLCSEPSFGKNSLFMVMHHILDKTPRLSGPTPAKLYQVITNNDVVVVDEMTSVKAEMVREIEGMVLQLGDNSTEYMKHSMTIGRQLKEADLVKKSLIFTYNRPQDIGKRSTFFDDKWNNKAAFKSRYPQFLLKGKVIGDADMYSYSEIAELVETHQEEIKQKAKELSYWTQYINKHMHNWSHEKCKLKGRHKTNLSGLLDALDAYCETQSEFDKWMEFIDKSMAEYRNLTRENDIGVEYETIKMGGN